MATLWSGTNFSRSVESNLYLLLLTFVQIVSHLYGMNVFFFPLCRIQATEMYVGTDRLMP